MADPTDVQLQNLNSCAEVADYIGFAGSAADAKTVRGAFFALYSLEDATKVATLGASPKADFDALLKNWKIDKGTD